MVENWVAQIISWLPKLFWHILKRYLLLVIDTIFWCFPFNHVPTYRELGRPSGDFGSHVGSPDRVMGRIWRLGDRLFTSLPKRMADRDHPRCDLANVDWCWNCEIHSIRCCGEQQTVGMWHSLHISSYSNSANNPCVLTPSVHRAYKYNGHLVRI